MNNRPDFDFCPDIRAELPRQAQAQFSAMQSHIEEFESFKESSVVEADKYRTPYPSEFSRFSPS